MLSNLYERNMNSTGLVELSFVFEMFNRNTHIRTHAYIHISLERMDTVANVWLFFFLQHLEWIRFLWARPLHCTMISQTKKEHNAGPTTEKKKQRGTVSICIGVGSRWWVGRVGVCCCLFLWNHTLRANDIIRTGWMDGRIYRNGINKASEFASHTKKMESIRWEAKRLFIIITISYQ